jgi:phage shock protein A
MAEHRRARAVGKSQQAQAAARTAKGTASIDRYKSRINLQQAVNHASKELTAGDSLEDRFAMLERDQRVEALLEELKSKKELTDGKALLQG